MYQVYYLENARLDEVSSVNDLEYDVSVVVREYSAATDDACIYSTWRNSLFYSNADAKRLPPSYAKGVFKDLTTRIRRILSTAKVRVACLEDDPNHIVGYVVFTGQHLDWVYVKEDYRGKGIASLMVPKDIETVTPPQTKIGKAIVEKKRSNKENDHAPEDEDRIKA